MKIYLDQTWESVKRQLEREIAKGLEEDRIDLEERAICHFPRA